MDVLLSEAHEPNTSAGALPSGGQRAPGSGGSHGEPLGPTGGRSPDGTPRFDQKVPAGGYLWWYVDGLSDDGEHGITMIAFVGSVFSSYYHWARARPQTSDPENHVCINLALYSKGKKRWTMTERGRRFLHRSSTEFTVGPSQLRWTGDELVIDINEWSVPVPMKVKGQMRIRADQFFHYQQVIDAQGRHRWGPLAPSARIEVDFPLPGLKWSGHAYLDSNEGDEPIEAPFHEWDWSRALLRDGSTAVIYDVRDRQATPSARAAEFNESRDRTVHYSNDQSSRLITARFKTNGEVEPFELGPRQPLTKGIWGVGRSIRSDPKAPAAGLLQTLEDTPFYMRSVVRQTLLGQEVNAMHETLFLPRVRSKLVRLMLPWRMPRRT